MRGGVPFGPARVQGCAAGAAQVGVGDASVYGALCSEAGDAGGAGAPGLLGSDHEGGVVGGDELRLIADALAEEVDGAGGLGEQAARVKARKAASSTGSLLFMPARVAEPAEARLCA